MRSLVTMLWLDGWAARSAGRRPGRRAARPRLAGLAGHWRMRTPVGANQTWWAASTAPSIRGGQPALLNFLYEVNEVDNGNHFAARQEPNLFTEEIRAAFR
jgi:hypothetical protein